MTFSIKKIYIDEKSLDSSITQNILKILKNIPYKVVNNPPLETSLTKGKKILYLKENNQNFLKKCPGTPVYLCCLYNVLHLAEHCPMDCSYCILQIYFKNPYLTIFTNINKMMKELKEAEKEKKILRIGTGEFTDSFALQKLAGWNKILIPFFSKSQNMFLELKSKYFETDFLQYKEHNRRVIISFSLNTIKVNKKEELLTSSIEERIKLAKLAYEAGFINSFHFDPIIDYPDCEKDYEFVVNLLFDNIPDKNICWISLGCFRFIPSLKEIASKRFPKTKIYYSEFHTGLDGKFRYFIKRRIELYNKIVYFIRRRSKIVPLYFCMENEKVWKAVFNYSPKNNMELAKYLDTAVVEVSRNI